ncbi:MAG TPA: sulfatase-like hydrolase/transferase [Terriglobales bacterium]|nr:sulfatase-like hydrolase/transferase [Terriglobales bacterium]
MSRTKKRRKAAPRPEHGRPDGPKPETRGERPAENAAPPDPRRGLLLGLAGALIVAASGLYYFLAIVPGRGRLRLPAKASLNVLLVTLDTTRPDHLGCYGDAAARTPSIDGLAAAGVRFERVYCQAPLTLPSHTSILTGLYPLRHGVRNNGHALAEGVRTLAEMLKANGYATAAFVSSFSVDSRFGLARGFDVYDDTFAAHESLKGANSQRRAGETFDRFSRWMDKAPGGRFFCWVHYYDPHLPYDPPSPYKEEFRDHLYDGEIAYMDHYVGALIGRLKAKGLFDDTLVVVAGDHGEGLGDKVELGHGVFLYDETLRVPLIFENPRVLTKPGVATGMVRLVDVAPTILDILGLGKEAAGMQGRSLVGWLGGAGRRDLDSLVETFFPKENFGWSELAAIVSGPRKYIQAPKPELYDLAQDPAEKKNLVEASAGRAAALKAALEAEIVRLGEGGPAAGTTGRTRAADLERLRSLGYVNFAPAKPGAAAPDPKDEIGLLKLIQRAQALEYRGEFAEAEKVYSEIEGAVPDSPESYIDLALIQARQERLDKALETLRRGLVRLPDSEPLLVRLGITYTVAGKSREALETMDKVLAMNPQNVDALTVAGNIMDTSGRKDEGRAYYERALAVEPENRFLRMNYAANLASVGKLREAIEVYKGLIEDFPEEQGFYQFAGIAYTYLGEFEPAIQYLERAVAIQPTPVGYFNLAVAFEKSGKPDDAVKSLRLYLADTRGEKEVSIRRARAELARLEKRAPGR